MTTHVPSRRFLNFFAFVMLVATVLGGRNAALAQSTFTPIESGPDDIDLMVSALADMDAPVSNRLLFLEGMAIGSCSAGEGSHAEGPMLVFAESYEVTVRFDNGTGQSDLLLKQGDSVLIPANTDFIVMNGMVDPAFQAEVLLLAVTRFRDGSTTEPIQPVVRLAKTMTDWPEGSFCKEIGDNALLHATFKVWGWAGTDATQLYLGTGVWDDGATTDGYAISSAPASFNLLILSGGMPTPGASTGRATYSGPRQVVSDTYGGVPSMHVPFTNPGASPVIGIIFGTTSDNQPVFVPIQE